MASSAPSPESQYQTPNAPRRVHMLGTGSVGKLVAHGLLGLQDPPPVTLCLHRPGLIEDFDDADRSITITTDGVDDTRRGMDVELALPNRPLLQESKQPRSVTERYKKYINDDVINNLIITVKAPQTINALSAVKHRLRPDSTILFLQNGMGIVEQVNEEIFPDAETRPNYMLGINSHGIYATGPFTAVHAGHGTMFLGLVPRIPFNQLTSTEDKLKESDLWGPSSRYLLRTIQAVPVFTATPMTPSDLLQAQAEKLAVNCIINPLTVMYDCHNGSLLSNFATKRVMRLLLSEICIVLQSLPELRAIPNVNERFGPDRMENFVLNVAEKTAKNISSMLQDTRRGVETEIEYLNGYIVSRGEEMGMRMTMNYMLMEMVKGKAAMISQEMTGYIPKWKKKQKNEEKASL